ncbi:MAG: hypothetical protein AAF542_05675 [Pseudomonadota bacterium]
MTSQLSFALLAASQWLSGSNVKWNADGRGGPDAKTILDWLDTITPRKLRA